MIESNIEKIGRTWRAIFLGKTYDPYLVVGRVIKFELLAVDAVENYRAYWKDCVKRTSKLVVPQLASGNYLQKFRFSKHSFTENVSGSQSLQERGFMWQ